MSTGTGIIPLVVIILGLGVAAQVLAHRLETPSVLFLILAGIAVGPEGLDIVGLASFGGPDALSAIVGLSVAIIIFEGAFHLKLTTVVFEGGFARHIAQALKVLPMRVIIVGGGRVGRGLAERLEDRGENVIIIDKDKQQVETARNAGSTVQHGDGADTDVLRSAGAENAKIVAAATGDDDANLLVAQLTNSKFDVETVIARVNTPGNAEAFEELGVRAISTDDSITQSMDNAVERPALSEWMTELGRTGDVQGIEVTAENLVGKTISDLDGTLPDGVLIALVSRDGDSQIPESDLALRNGDHLTFVGRRDAVHRAIEQCHPELRT